MKCSHLVPWVDGIGDSSTDDGSCENHVNEHVPPGYTLDSSRNVNAALEEQTSGEGEKNTSKLPLFDPLAVPKLGAHSSLGCICSCVISQALRYFQRSHRLP